MSLPSMIDIPIDLIEDLRNNFYQHTTKTACHMEKLSPIKQFKCVQNLVDYLKFDLDDLVGDNYYKHALSYFPHVDAPIADSKKYLHLVVPLEKEYEEEQHFIIFDQYSKIGQATWTGLLDEDIPFQVNVQKKGYIDSSDIENYIENGIDDSFAGKYLAHPIDWYNGLSGKAYKWTPGKGIMFPSNRLHASGKMPGNKHKLGITFKFKMKYNVY